MPTGKRQKLYFKVPSQHLNKTFYDFLYLLKNGWTVDEGPFLKYICMLVMKSSNKIAQKTQFSSTTMDSVLREVETKGHRGFHSSMAQFLFHAECISKGVVYNEGGFLNCLVLMHPWGIGFRPPTNFTQATQVLFPQYQKQRLFFKALKFCFCLQCWLQFNTMRDTRILL